jgi:threonine/homoserine/homoserine lactone efflux protein
LIGDVLNPKVGLFYTTIFPQFIEPGASVAPVAAALLLTHAVVLLIWYPGVAYTLSRAGRALKRPQLAKALDRVTGAVLVAMGVRLAIASR